MIDSRRSEERSNPREGDEAAYADEVEVAIETSPEYAAVPLPGGITTPPPSSSSSPSTLLNVCIFIIVCEFCERLAYYGMAGSLVLLLQDELNFTNADADNQFSLWSGFCYVTPLLGGWIADSYLGRYRSIMIFSLIYIVGLVLLVVGVLPGDVSAGVIFTAIYVIALGTGGIKPNVSTYGAEQFDVSKPRDQRELDSFFVWFYWSINLGALISYTLVASICQFGVKSLGGKDWRFAVGFTIPLIAMVLAVLLFVAGTPRYKNRPPHGSVVTTAIKIISQASWSSITTKINTTRRGGSGSSNDGGGGASGSSRHHHHHHHWLDRAKERYGGSYRDVDVEGVKCVWRLLPFLLVTVPYWSIYNQMSTAFQNQGCQMDLHLGTMNIAVSTLQLFDTLAILLLIPIFDGVLYPFFKRRGKPLTMLTKIGWGFFTAVLAMLTAAVVEIYRKKMSPPETTYLDYYARGDLAYAHAHVSACKNIDDFNPFAYQDWWQRQHQGGGGGGSKTQPAYCTQTCDTLGADGKLSLDCISCPDVPLVSPVSVMWQIPQFILVGTSEILASVTGLEFFFSQAPNNMKSFTQALNLFTTALGAWLCIPLVYAVNSNPHHQWVPTDLNRGYLSSYFWLLAGLMVVTLVIFIYLAQGYEYKEVLETDPASMPLSSAVSDTGVDDDGDEQRRSSNGGGGGGDLEGEEEGDEPEFPLLSPPGSSYSSPNKHVKAQARGEIHE